MKEGIQMNLNKLNILQETKIVLQFEWSSYDMEQTLIEDGDYLNYNGYPFLKYQEELIKGTEKVEHKEMSGIALTTINNVFLYEAALQEKGVSIEIDGQMYGFFVHKKVYDESSDTIYLVMHLQMVRQGDTYSTCVLRKPVEYEARKKELYEEKNLLNQNTRARLAMRLDDDREQRVLNEQQKRKKTGLMITHLFKFFQNKTVKK